MRTRNPYLKIPHPKRINNSSGFTLIEVLMAVTLFSLLAAGLIAIAMSSMNQTDEAQKNIRLQNETQSIMTNMWGVYNAASEDGKDAVDIPITRTKNAPEDFVIDHLVINGEIVDGSAKQIENVDPSKALTIEIITKSDAPDAITMQTTWKPVADGTRMCGIEPGTLTEKH